MHPRTGRAYSRTPVPRMLYNKCTKSVVPILYYKTYKMKHSLINFPSLIPPTHSDSKPWDRPELRIKEGRRKLQSLPYRTAPAARRARDAVARCVWRPCARMPVQLNEHTNG